MKKKYAKALSNGTCEKIIAGALFILLAFNGYGEAGEFRFRLNNNGVFRQGEVMKIWFDCKGKVPIVTPFQIEFLGRNYKSALFDGKHTVLIGIDYSLRPGTYYVRGAYQIPTSLKFYPILLKKIRVIEKYPKLRYRKPPVEEKETEDERAERERFRKESTNNRGY